MEEKKEKGWIYNQQSLVFLTVLAGMLFLAVVYIVAIFVFKNATQPAETIVAVIGAVTGILGTLIGYVAGQSGKEKAEDKAEQRVDQAQQRTSEAQAKLNNVNEKLNAVLYAAPPDVLKEAQEKYKSIFE